MRTCSSCANRANCKRSLSSLLKVSLATGVRKWNKKLELISHAKVCEWELLWAALSTHRVAACCLVSNVQALPKADQDVFSVRVTMAIEA